MDEKELLDIYMDYLISSFDLTTGTGLSRLLDGVISHDRIQRFLASPAKSGKDLWKAKSAKDRVYIANYSIPINPGRQADHIIIRRVAIVEVAGKDDARTISVDGCMRLAPVAAIVVRGSGVGNIELTTTRY